LQKLSVETLEEIKREARLPQNSTVSITAPSKSIAFLKLNSPNLQDRHNFTKATVLRLQRKKKVWFRLVSLIV